MITSPLTGPPDVAVFRDPDATYDEMVNTAAAELPALAAATGAHLTGWPHWSIQETGDLPGWRDTPTVLVAEAWAEPAPAAVRKMRRRHHIPPGVGNPQLDGTQQGQAA